MVRPGGPFTLACSLAVFVAACSGGGLEAWTSQEIVAEFERIHRPVADVYRVPPTQPEALWALLDGSFSGEALTQEYLEHFVTASGMARDRARIRIASFDYDTVRIEARSETSARVEADWSVGGLVTHRAHTHPRINRYRAVFDLEPAAQAPGELRIVRTQIRDLERQRRLREGDGERADSAQGSLSLGDLLRSGMLEQVREAEESAETDEAPGAVR